MIVAIEGIDGCGKTTQAKILVQKLQQKGYKAIYVQPALLLIRRLPFSPRRSRAFQFGGSTKSSAKKTLVKKGLFIMGIFVGYLYALVSFWCIVHLARKNIVVCDRFFYQFFFDLLGSMAEKVVRIFPKPQATFFLDVDLDILYLRMTDPFDVNVSRDYYKELIEMYRRLSARYNFVRIPANLGKETINDLIFKTLVNQKIHGMAKT